MLRVSVIINTTKTQCSVCGSWKFLSNAVLSDRNGHTGVFVQCECCGKEMFLDYDDPNNRLASLILREDSDDPGRQS